MASKKGQLMAFKHEGFWQCMDTKRDKDNLEELLKKWKIRFHLNLKIMAESLLILGGNGFIGKHLAAKRNSRRI